MNEPRRNHHHLLLLHLSLALISATPLTVAVDFLFNGFGPSDVSLYGNATVDSRILTLTNDSTFSIGRALYHAKIPAKHPNSTSVLPFYTSFIFAMAPYRGRLPGHGIFFLLTPRVGIEGASSAQHLGLFNFTNNGNTSNHVFGVEFDVFENEEFNDINANHVGLDLNSLISVNSSPAGYWPNGGRFTRRPFRDLVLNNGRNYQVWIDYADGTVNVTMAPAGTHKPHRPLLSFPVNLSSVFEDEMYVGFTASTGALIESHKILAWSFSNTNLSLGQSLITRGLPNFELPKTPFHKTIPFIVGLISGAMFLIISCSVVAFLLIRRNRRIQRERAQIEDWELEYWPHRIAYQEIKMATKNFSEQNMIGGGGNGKVYRGTLPGGSDVAVKRMSLDNNDGIRAFLSEISILGRLKHRNLVGLKGWCKEEKGSLMLVYEYMKNGSLDKRVFDSYEESETKILSFEDRIRILKQVASGILYLHHGWESKVLHRDIKSSNVLLDKEMNARLGDFGLARMHDHDKAAGTTRVVGTVGYLAPEIVRSGRTSTQTDVFGYGVLVLEVVCGRGPVEEGRPPLLDWARELWGQGELVSGMDARLWAHEGGVLDELEAERVLSLGLLCTHPDPKARPTMRQVVKLLEGRSGAAAAVAMEEPGEEDMDLWLLDKMRDGVIPSADPRVYGSGSGSHPTFDELTRGWSNSMSSSSWTNTTIDGR